MTRLDWSLHWCCVYRLCLCCVRIYLCMWLHTISYFALARHSQLAVGGVYSVLYITYRSTFYGYTYRWCFHSHNQNHNQAITILLLHLLFAWFFHSVRLIFMTFFHLLRGPKYFPVCLFVDALVRLFFASFLLSSPDVI